MNVAESRRRIKAGHGGPAGGEGRGAVWNSAPRGGGGLLCRALPARCFPAAGERPGRARGSPPGRRLPGTRENLAPERKKNADSLVKPVDRRISLTYVSRKPKPKMESVMVCHDPVNSEELALIPAGNFEDAERPFPFFLFDDDDEEDDVDDDFDDVEDDFDDDDDDFEDDDDFDDDGDDDDVDDDDYDYEDSDDYDDDFEE
ncbi:MAG: hypothetical protein LBC88_05950 [Spirochaetaceae bacterium]|nr:hypothetical protein [Spirochaetaceae bacterium]